MKISAILTLVVFLLLVACDKNETKVTVDDTPNRIVEVNFSPVKEEGKEDRVQMEIVMELNSIFPAYPQMGSGLKAEKLKLSFVRNEIGEDFYRGVFTFVPTDDVEVLNMEDFTWTPYIDFDPVKLPTSQGQIKAE